MSRLQYHFQPAATGPHAIAFMQKDANGENYLTSVAQPNALYVPAPPPPSSNPCQSATPAQQQFHLIRLQNSNPPPPPPPTQSNQTMHIKQLHTATVHGMFRVHLFVPLFKSFAFRKWAKLLK